MTVDRLRGAFANLWNTSSDDNWIVGRLGWKTSETTYDLAVRGMPKTYYVSLGYDGDLAKTTAFDAAGVLVQGWVELRMRRENGKLVIREASAYAAGGSGGGGGGVSNLDALDDVTVSGPTHGQVLVYDSSTGQWGNAASPGGLAVHGLSSGYHNGLLNWGLINFSGSNLTSLETRVHANLQGIGPNDHHPQLHVLATGTGLGGDHTITGAAAGEVLRAIDATHAAFDVLHHTDLDNILPDQHHKQVHLLATDAGLGPDHTISGAVPGYVLRATSPTAAQFMQLNHNDLDNVLPDQHHPWLHNIITGTPTFGPAHSITGFKFQLVGAVATDTLGLLTPTHAPAAAEAILKTDAYGGIQLDTNLLYVDAADNWVGINRTPAGAALDITAFSTGDITQRIKQIPGQTQRLWRVEDSAGQELIVLDNVGNLQSGQPGFVSGLLGWQISYNGNAEFNNIWARGELHATVFVKDEIHATGGSLLVASAGTLHDDAGISSAITDDDVMIVYSKSVGWGVPMEVVTTSPTFEGNVLHVSHIGNIIAINDPPSGPAFYFQPGDVVRSKTEVATGVTDFWLEVNGAQQMNGYANYNVIKRSGTDGTLPKGSAVVSYGKQGDGRIMLTSDLNYAPYIDVFTIGPQVWTANAGSIIPHVRIGRLDGVGIPGSHIARDAVYHPGDGLPGITGDGSTPQYGMIAGQDLSNANSPYLIASDKQLALYKVNLRLNNGIADTGLWTADGNLRIGKNVGADATTGFRVYTTDGPTANAGDVIIGNVGSHNYLMWSQATGSLIVEGQLIVGGGGGSVDQDYVDFWDQHYYGLSTTAANTAQGNAQVYGTARRLVGVTGTWSSPGPNQISWTGLSASFANNTSRSIAVTGSPLTIGARTYLYVNVGGTGTITMLTTTNPATIAASPDNVLIAVADPGTPKASVTVVAGTTYISGTNIATQSITANQIAATTITGGQIAGTTITAGHLTADVFTTASDQGAAKASGQRVLAVTGSFVSTGYQSISWGTPTNVTVVKGDASPPITIADGVLNASSVPPLTTRLFLYILATDSGTTTMKWVNNIDSLPLNAIMIAVVTPGTTGVNGTENATIIQVGGSVVISGDAIAAGSIIADRLKANSITSAQIAADVYMTASSKRVMAVNGTFTPSLTNAALVSWTGVSVVRGDASAPVTVSASNTGTMAARTYLYILEADVGTVAMKSQTNIDLIPPNAIMVAVCEPGVEAASAVVVGGGVVISGDDIVAGSINADRIVADTITAVQLAPSYETALTTQINTAAANAASSAGSDAVTDANLYSAQRRLIGVTGTWTVTGRNAMTWSAFTASMGSGNKSVATGTFSSTTFVRRYFYIDISLASPTLLAVTDPTTLSANHVMIAILEPGKVASPSAGGGMATVTVLGGTTWIAGDQIITDTIIGNHIKANAIVGDHIVGKTITADKMEVQDLSVMRGDFTTLNTGPLTVNGALAMNQFGKLYSGTKTTYDNAQAGFFLGYDSAFPLAAYKFKVGDVTKAQFSWDGSSMAFNVTQALQVRNTGSGQVLSMSGPNNQTTLLTVRADGVLESSSWMEMDQLMAGKLIVTRATFQIEDARTIATPTSLGLAGEICWDSNYLYVCIAPSFWKRIPLYAPPVYTPSIYW